jgi:hypothetical protein
MLRTLLTTLVVVAPAFAPREDLDFAPLPGTRVVKTFETTSRVVLDGASLVMDGEHTDVALELESTATTKLVVRDEYAEVASGRPTRLERAYDTVEANAVTTSRTEMTGGGTVEVASVSPLAGRAVRFEWDGAAGRHTRRFSDEESAPDEAEAALLAGLEEDLDLRAFLPSQPRSVGDRWLVEPGAIAAFLAPGGALGLAPSDPDQAAALARLGGSSGLVGLLGSPTGTIEGRLVSLDGAPGDRRARIEITFDLRFVRELAESDWPPFVDPFPPGREPVSATLRSTRLDALLDEGTAVLVFGLDSGRFEEFSADLAIDLALDQQLTLTLGDDSLEVELALEFTLEQALSVSVRPL